MTQESIWTAAVTAITVLGSSSAWRFYERRAAKKEKNESYMRDECRERIAKLEALLIESAKEKMKKGLFFDTAHPTYYYWEKFVKEVMINWNLF